MKWRMFLLLCVVTLCLTLTSSEIVIAQDNNAAVVINITDGPGHGCRIPLYDGTQWIYIYGNVVFVGTENGQWKISCKGTFQLDPPLKMAMEYRSDKHNPWWRCISPYGETNNVFANFTPSGEAMMMCKGDKTP